MKFLIIAFKSRNTLYSFHKLLKANGLIVSLINTPRRVSISCGLSIKTDHNNLSVIINLLSNFNNRDLLGVFLIEKNNFNERAQRIY